MARRQLNGLVRAGRVHEKFHQICSVFKQRKSRDRHWIFLHSTDEVERHKRNSESYDDETKLNDNETRTKRKGGLHHGLTLPAAAAGCALFLFPFRGFKRIIGCLNGMLRNLHNQSNEIRAIVYPNQ